jgi:hypothetical protein
VQTTPLVFAPPVGEQRVGICGRLLALVLAATAMGMLVTAVLIKPSPDGVGTHRQIRYLSPTRDNPPPCELLRITGIPCPTCGMTTSYAHFVRGNWLASLYVQPMGFLLALATGAFFWACLVIAATGAPLHRLLAQTRAGVFWITAIIGFAIAAWGWKIFIHLAHMDGWR